MTDLVSELLSPDAAALLDALYADDARQRAAGLPTSQRTRNLDRGSGEFLALTVLALGAKTIVEMGSSNGVSTIWLASAARRTGGRVYGSELIPDRAALANRNLAAAGLGDTAHVYPGDARQTLPETVPAGTQVDLLFLDAEKDDYSSHLLAMVDRVRVGGVILADNVTSHDASVYQALVRSRPNLATITLPLERGMEYTVKLA